MIFTTLEEKERVIDTIKNGNEFKELKDFQNDIMRGFYWSIEKLNNLRYNFNYEADAKVMEKLYNEIAREVIDECTEALIAEAAEMYVSFMDNNYVEEIE